MSWLPVALVGVLVLLVGAVATMLLFFMTRAALMAIRHQRIRLEMGRISEIVARHRRGGFAEAGRLIAEVGPRTDPDLLDDAMRRGTGAPFSDLDPRVRARVRKIYEAFDLPDRHLERLGNSPLWRERADSALLLAQLGDARAIPTLVATLRDPDEDTSTVKAAAGRALGMFDIEGTVEALLGELSELDEWSSVRVADILVGLGNRAHAPASQGLRDGTDNLRMWSARILGRVGDSSAVPVLLGALDDPVPRVRAAAAEALGLLGDPRALPGLESRILREPSAEVRSTAARALGVIGDDDALTPLVLALGEPDYWVRARIIQAIDALGPRSPEPIIRALEGPDEALARGAAAALVRLGYAREWLDAMTDPTSGTSATEGEERLRALARLGELRGVVRALQSPAPPTLQGRFARILGSAGPPVADEARRVLRPMLRSAYAGVRAEAAAAYASLRPRDLQPLLRAVGDADPDVRTAAIDSLILAVPHCDLPPDWAHRLADLARSRDPALRTLALDLLDARPIPDASEPALLLLVDPDPGLRVRAVELLSDSGARAVAPLGPMLDDLAEEVRVAVAQALGRIGGPGAIRRLVAAARDSDPTTREEIAAALAKHGFDVLDSAWDTRRHTPPGEGRRAVGWARAKTGDRRAAVLLERFLGEMDPRVRASAAGALGRCPGEASIRALARPLLDPDARVRAAAVNALARTGGPAERPLLDGPLADPDGFVRRRALVALGRLGGPSSLARLAEALMHRGADEDAPYAAVGLTLVGTPAAVAALADWLHGASRLQDFAAAIQDEPALEAERIRESLGHFPIRPTAAELRGWARSLQTSLIVDMDPDQRLRGLELLRCADAGNRFQWLAPVVRSDPDGRVRARGVELLEHEDARTVQVLGAALTDPVVAVGMAALRSIAGAEWGADAADVLAGWVINVAGGGDIGFDHLARVALARLHAGRPTHLAAAVDVAPRPETRIVLLRALGDSRHPARDSELLRFLTHPDDVVRSEAAGALSTSTDPSVISGLMRSIEDESPRVRLAAIEALGTRAADRARAALAVAVNDPDPGVRAAALRVVPGGEG